MTKDELIKEFPVGCKVVSKLTRLKYEVVGHYDAVHISIIDSDRQSKITMHHKDVYIDKSPTPDIKTENRVADQAIDLGGAQTLYLEGHNTAHGGIKLYIGGHDYFNADEVRNLGGILIELATQMEKCKSDA